MKITASRSEARIGAPRQFFGNVLSSCWFCCERPVSAALEGDSDNWRVLVSWPLVLSGACAAVLLALGLDVVSPLGGGLDTLCDLVGVVSGVLFVGLADGA
jgi:hypothetical protein